MSVNPLSERPIGIFDSGVGGLTVAHAIHEALPGENLLYFGDTIHFPYGDKSEAAIRSYSEGITEFLLKNDCKLIVIACHTASSFGYDAVKKIAGDKVPVVNVIDPVAEYISRDFSGKRIGVIGTRGTVGSNVYQRKINQLDSSVIVQSLATPLLAPMVEEGLIQNEVSRAAVAHYLRNSILQDIDALILACTHYPLLRKEIVEYYNNKMNVIDSAEVAARDVAALLEERGLLNTSGRKSQQHFYVSDLTPSFQQTASIFFREKIQLSHYNIWNNN